MSTGLDSVQVSLLLVLEASDHSASNHKPSRHPDTSPWFSLSGFPDDEEVAPLLKPCAVWVSPFPGRPATTARRIEFTCVTDSSFTSSRSAPPHGDSVTSGYGTPEQSCKDFHLADPIRRQAHRVRLSAPPIVCSRSHSVLGRRFSISGVKKTDHVDVRIEAAAISTGHLIYSDPVRQEALPGFGPSIRHVALCHAVAFSL